MSHSPLGFKQKKEEPKSRDGAQPPETPQRQKAKVLTCTPTEQDGAMHFPVCFFTIFLASHVSAKSYPEWSKYPQLNLTYAHRHGSEHFNHSNTHRIGSKGVEGDNFGSRFSTHHEHSGGENGRTYESEKYGHRVWAQHTTNRGPNRGRGEDIQQNSDVKLNNRENEKNIRSSSSHHRNEIDDRPIPIDHHQNINALRHESRKFVVESNNSGHSFLQHHKNTAEIKRNVPIQSGLIPSTRRVGMEINHYSQISEGERQSNNFEDRHVKEENKNYENREIGGVNDKNDRKNVEKGNRGNSEHVRKNSSYSHRHTGIRRHGNRGGSEEFGSVTKEDEGGPENIETQKLTVVDSTSVTHYNPYNKHQSGRHVCTRNPNKPVKTRQPYCKPTFKNYVIQCQGNQICKGVRLVYETHYKDVVTSKNSDELVYACCPGWTQVTNRSNGCAKATCSKPCLNGGKCVKPELCACLKGFAGQQCEIPVIPPECQKPCLNGGQCIKKDTCSCLKDFSGPQCENDLRAPYCTRGCENGGICVQNEVCQCPTGFTGRRCEKDIDECKDQKPCDQICYNTPGSYNCQCKEDFVLQKDGQTCQTEDDNVDGGLEAKDLEFEMLDKRLLKLETMMDESHKKDVSKDDLKNVYRDINNISEDMNSLRSKIMDVENYKNDMYIFKTKLNSIEKKAEKVDDLMLKYDRMKKCAFYNKICM